MVQPTSHTQKSEGRGGLQKNRERHNKVKINKFIIVGSSSL